MPEPRAGVTVTQGDVAIAALERAARHPFQRRSGYGQRDGRFDDCYRCRRDKGDGIHDEQAEPYNAMNSDYIVIDLLNRPESLARIVGVVLDATSQSAVHVADKEQSERDIGPDSL